MANGESTKIHGIGMGTLTFLDESGCIRKAKATEVLYAPKLVGNVLSVRQLAKNGLKVEFDDRICQIKYDNQQIGVADAIGELYVLRQPDSVCAVLAHNDECIHTLHRKMGHRDPAAIRKMASNGSIKGLEIVECGIKEECDTCMKGKMTRLPFPKKSTSVGIDTFGRMWSNANNDSGWKTIYSHTNRRFFWIYICHFTGTQIGG